MVPQITPGENPFEKIRYKDHTGEWWSARELMPLMDYGRYDAFAAIIEKAKAALALIEGAEAAESNFLHVQKITDQGYKQADYRLTRFGAYLAAMAGDDTKKAVALARIYFAVKAREAEVALPERHLLEPRLDPDLARIYELTLGMQQTRDEVKAIEAEQQRMAGELQGVAEDVADLKAISPISSKNMLALRDAARAVTGNEMGQNRFKKWLMGKGIMFVDHQGQDRLKQSWVNDGLGIERWQDWANGKGQSWVPYFTVVGVAKLRRMYQAEEDGAAAA